MSTGAIRVKNITLDRTCGLKILLTNNICFSLSLKNCIQLYLKNKIVKLPESILNLENNLDSLPKDITTLANTLLFMLDLVIHM